VAKVAPEEHELRRVIDEEREVEGLSSEDLLAIYRKAWDIYYSPEHVERVIRRAKAWGYDPRNMMVKLLSFHAIPAYRKRASVGGRTIPTKVPP